MEVVGKWSVHTTGENFGWSSVIERHLIVGVEMVMDKDYKG